MQKIEMLTDVKGKVGNLVISKNNTYLPVYEAIVNSIQAISERKDLPMKEGRISIVVNRGINKKTNVKEKDDTIIGFEIHDNGCGFNETNFKSFIHSDSTHKIEIGGKGVGRFTWLKTFEKVEIESIFLENDVKKKRYIKFTLDEVSSSEPVETDEEQKTIVKLIGFKQEYRIQEGAYKTTEKIAQRILEHCLSYYINENYPKIFVESEKTINLSIEFDELKNGIFTESFEINGIEFNVSHIIMHDTVQDVNKFILCADDRAVLFSKISFLGNTSLFYDDKKYYYSAYIFGDYLNKNVSMDRIGFRIPNKRDLDMENFPVTIDMILNEAEKLSKKHLIKYMEEAEQTKRNKLNSFVSENPFFRTVYKYHKDEILDEISPDSTDEKINEVLYKYKGQAEHQNKKEIEKILKENPSFSLIQDTEKMLKQINETQKDDLAHYIIHRKLVLDLFNNKLKLNKDGKYNLEKDIHNIIFPQKTDSDLIDYDNHNLWLIDEALTFYNYAASEKPLNSLSDSESNDRPDIIIFSEGNNSSGICDSVSIIELKRPQTDDIKIIDQLYRYMDNIKENNIYLNDGTYLKTRKGTKFFCYALCNFDKNEELVKYLDSHEFKPMRDEVCYYKFNGYYNAQIEVLSYDWVVLNASQRLKIYLEKLGI